MSVHYKFKSALDFDTITFDGLHINVADLKKAIVHQKRLGKTTDFDLQITNAQTKEGKQSDSGSDLANLRPNLKAARKIELESVGAVSCPRCRLTCLFLSFSFCSLFRGHRADTQKHVADYCPSAVSADRKEVVRE